MPDPTRETLPNGTVLVRYPGLPAIDSAGFSEDGDCLGSVRLGFESAGPLRVRHGHIYAWVTDELDVPYVVRAPLFGSGAER